jgi:carbonyl reductase 1
MRTVHLGRTSPLRAIHKDANQPTTHTASGRISVDYRRRIGRMVGLSNTVLLLGLLAAYASTSTGVLAFAGEAPSRNKIALVTGGNKGIGKEIVRRLGSDPDITCLIACRDVDLGEKAAADLRSDVTEDGVACDAIALPIPFDLTDEESIEACAKYVQDEYGVLDILVNNAAICFNDPTLYGVLKEPVGFRDQADITIKTNYFGTLAATQSFLRLLNKSPSPRIINIASAAGRLSILQSQELMDKFTSESLTISELSELMETFVADVQGGTHSEKGWPNTCYGVSKLGIIALTKILARQYSDILCNSVDPGYCKTDQNNNQGVTDPSRGAYTPYLLAVMESESDEEGEETSGLHFFEESEIPWSYQ